jgi:hypothetical protein
MLTNQEPDWNIDDLTDPEIYAAIHYLEAGPRTEDKQDANNHDTDSETQAKILKRSDQNCRSCSSDGLYTRFDHCKVANGKK